MPLEEAGTELDPYKIESLSDWIEIPDYDSDTETKYFDILTELDFSGQSLSRFDFYGDMNWNGNRLIADDLSFRNVIRMLEGIMYGGEISVTLTAYNNDAFIIDSIVNPEGIKRMKLSGSLAVTSTNNCGAIRNVGFSGSGVFSVENVISELDLESVDGNCGLILNGSTGAKINNVIAAGTHSTTGAGTAYAVTGFATDIVSNCFYDITKNPSVTESNEATGKTTTELQTLSTYTDAINTTNLDEAYDMVSISSFDGSQTWIISNSDGVAYPNLGWSTELTVLEYQVIRQGVAQAGVKVTWWQMDAFAANNIVSGAFNNMVELGSAVTDANGVASLNVSGIVAYDDTKVHFAAFGDAFYRTSDSKWLLPPGFSARNIDMSPPI